MPQAVQSLPYVAWTLLTALAFGTFAFVVGGVSGEDELFLGLVEGVFVVRPRHIRIDDQRVPNQAENQHEEDQNFANRGHAKILTRCRVNSFNV